MNPDLFTNLMIAVSVLVTTWGFMNDEGHKPQSKKNKRLH